MYPNTVLSTSASERWLKDPESEVFMDRDPVLFRQVLAYLRDKKVYLPTTVAKKALLSELEYFCVDNVDEDAIDDSLAQGYMAAKGLEKMVDSISNFDEGYNVAMEGVKVATIEANSILVAKKCAETFLALRATRLDQKEFLVDVERFEADLPVPKTFYLDACQKHLKKVGLQMLKSKSGNIYNKYQHVISRINGKEDTNTKRKISPRKRKPTIWQSDHNRIQRPCAFKF